MSKAGELGTKTRSTPLPSKAWLSKGIESLYARLHSADKNAPSDDDIFDVLIIGSGYGGSVAAKELSGLEKSNLRICVLERGREFLPGSFPSNTAEAPTEIRTSPAHGGKPKGNLEGLFDIRLGHDLNVIQANGLGGGSLINAGVMARADDSIFDGSKWPSAINADNLRAYYAESEEILGAISRDANERVPNTILKHQLFNSDKGPSKYESLKKLAKGANKSDDQSRHFKSANLTISMREETLSSAGIKLNACNLCGDCASGCNNNAKNSLDKNLLATAAQQGVEIFTGVTVNSIAKETINGITVWRLNTVYTDETLRSRQQQQVQFIHAKNVILAAGAMGSTEILLRSQSKELSFSDLLGQQFSSNGDMMIVGYGQQEKANAIATPSIKHSERNVGPTITGMIDLRQHPDKDQRMVIQEMAVPAAASHFFTELYSTTASIRNIWSRDLSAHKDGNNFDDPAAIDPTTLLNTSLYATMGHDDAAGKCRFSHTDAKDHEGTLQIQWPSLKQHTLFDKQFTKIQSLTGSDKPAKGNKGIGGMTMPNPFWQLLKPSSMQMLNLKKGAPLTVHPLGGCPMGESIKTGVANHQGRVFDPQGDGFHDGLLVLDGALIPEAVGINPALTITAVCLKAIRELCAEDFFKATDSYSKAVKNSKTISNKTKLSLKNTPIIRSMEQLETEASRPKKNTEVTLTERLIGFSKLAKDDGTLSDAVVEISLWSKPIATTDLSEHRGHLRGQKTKLLIDTEKANSINGTPLSKIRIYYHDDWQALRSEHASVDVNEVVLDNSAQFIGSIEGHIALLGRAQSYPLSRIIESTYAWLLNRGIRDIHQSRNPLQWEISEHKTSSKSWFQSLKLTANYVSGIINSFTRAGEVRTVQYNLSVATVYKSDDFAYFKTPAINSDSSNSNNAEQPHNIIGRKRLSYIRRSNPWLQLSEVRLEKLPSSPQRQLILAKKNIKSLIAIRNLFIHSPQQYQQRQEAKRLQKMGNRLTIDLNYLAKNNAPLLQISQQENQVQALMDLSSFATYITRMLVAIHFHSFRAPETPAPRDVKRQALGASGLPMPSITRLVVDSIPDNRVGALSKGDDVSILLTHYAHANPTKPPILMVHGYSASSTTFAHESLPDSLAKFCFTQGRDVWLLDLRTSCALESARYPWSFEDVAETDIPTAVDYIYKIYKGRCKIDVVTHCMGSVMLGMSILKFSEAFDNDPDFFKKRLNKIVFSQATPALKFTQDNNFRSFATSYLKEIVPDDYQFQPRNGQASSVLDRVLYTLPYPAKEYDVLNAPFTPSKRANFARTRHRMDAFFTRTFELNNVSAATLDCIDDFFGPIHVNTIIQASQFANNNVIADQKGRNEYLSRDRLKRYWGSIPTMSFHSRNNGLIDYSTGERSKRIFREGGVPYHCVLIENEDYGHQDSMIGPDAHIDIFPHISDFLDGDVLSDPPCSQSTSVSTDSAGSHLIIEPPAIGPLIIEASKQGQNPVFAEDHIRIAFGTNVARAARAHPVFLPVKKNGESLELLCKQGQSPLDSIKNNIELAAQATVNSSSWWKIVELPKSIFNTNQADGLALFLIYDDLVSLCPTSSPSSSAVSIDQGFQISAEEICSIEDLSQAMLNLFENHECHYQQFSSGLIELRETPSTTVSFALGSCQYPGGILDKQLAYRSYASLDQRLLSQHSNKPQFLTLMGDQIYADATAGLLDPSTKFDRYSMPYLHLYEQQHVRSVLRKLPSYNMLDDHEIIDNWEPVINNDDRAQALKNARDSGVKAFLKYQRGEERQSIQGSDNDSMWYHFCQQQHDFFMCDTRTQRAARTAENIIHPQTTIIDETQHSSLEQWLQNSTEKSAKFVLSSSMLLPRHAMLHGNGGSTASAIRTDSWDGYPVSLHRLLAFLVDQQKDNIVFLSGDDHIACFAEIDITNKDSQKSITTWSAHCPGLYTPFPFANGRIDDFEGELDNDQTIKTSHFEFQHNKITYRCRVKARFGHSENQEIELGPINIEALGGFLLISTR